MLRKKRKECENSKCVGSWITLIPKSFRVYFVTNLLNFREVCFGFEQGNNALSRMIAEDCKFCYSSVWKYRFSQSYMLFSQGVS